jgi:uncharacterized membrane protein YkoI
MTIGKRIYWVAALVAVMALAGAGVAVTSRITSADEPDPTPAVQTSGQQDEADDAGEHAAKGPDTDAVQEESGSHDEAESPNGGTDTVVPCSEPASADNDAAEAQSGPDTDNIAEQCGDQNEADDATDLQQSGVLDDGKDLLPQAQITLDHAIAAAQSAASGAVGEIDLEQTHGRLVFNVDIGDKDVKVDASDGSIVAVDSDD